MSSPRDDIRIPSAESTDGGLHRRRFLQLSALAAVTAAVAAACGDNPAASGVVPQVGQPGTPTTAPTPPLNDVTLLRTATSIELLLHDVYGRAIDGGQLGDEAATAARRFRDHHRAHASRFQQATRAAGGDAFDEPSPRLTEIIVQPALEEAEDETDVLSLLHRLEELAADSYQSFVASFTTPELRVQSMEVGAVTARQAAVLAVLLPHGSIIAVPETAAEAPADGAATTTTTTMAPAEGEAPPDPVYAVPGAFGSTATAVGPSAYV